MSPNVYKSGQLVKRYNMSEVESVPFTEQQIIDEIKNANIPANENLVGLIDFNSDDKVGEVLCQDSY